MSPRAASTTRVAWRLARQEPVAYALTWIGWVTFFATPLLTGLVVKIVLDRVAGAPTGDVATPWALLAVLVGIEVVRWTWLIVIAVQWHGCWVGWQTVPRVNLLRSLVAAPGPAAGRLPGSPGEAVSRSRDDVQDLAMVLDVWLDLSGAGVVGHCGCGPGHHRPARHRGDRRPRRPRRHRHDMARPAAAALAPCRPSRPPRA